MSLALCRVELAVPRQTCVAYVSTPRTPISSYTRGSLARFSWPPNYRKIDSYDVE